MRSTPATLDAATPLLRQLRGLVSEDELRGLVADLRPAIPDLARMTRRTIPLLEQVRPLRPASTRSRPLVAETSSPTSDNQTINGDGSAARLFEETDYGLDGLSGREPLGRRERPLYPRARQAAARTSSSIAGTPTGSRAARSRCSAPCPALDSSAKAPFRPDVACETPGPAEPLARAPAPPPDPSSGRARERRSFTPRWRSAPRTIARRSSGARAAQPERERKRERAGRGPPRQRA